MSTAGDYVGEEVWHRIVQIVTNTEELQEYAARKAYEHLRSPTCHENIVKVAAYLLGEFGHLIAAEDDPSGVQPIEQFSLINNKISISSPATKALILTTYVKWLNLFPEIREHILAVLRKFTHTLDSELQQRACEYLAIAEMPEDEILQVVLDEMPPFPEQRESALVGRLVKKHGGDSGDKRNFAAGKDVKGFGSGSGAAGSAQARRKAAPANGVNGSSGQEGETPEHAALVAINENDGRTGIDDSDDIMANLAGLDLSGNTGAMPATQTQPAPLLATPAAAEASAPLVQAEQPLITSTIARNGSPSLSGPSTPAVSTPATVSVPTTPAGAAVPASAAAAAVQYTHGADKWLQRLVYNSEGILFEDTQLQIGLKSEFHGHSGRLALYFGNKLPVPFASFTVTVESSDPAGLLCTMPKIGSSTLQATTQVQQVVQVECRAFFAECPTLRVSYLAGSLQEVTLRLPVFVNKFLEPVSLGQADFFERWKQIGGPPREAQAIFPVRLGSRGEVDHQRHKKVVKGIKWEVLEGIDPNPNNVVGAAVLHSQGGKVGCLLRLEPNDAAKMCRLTIRSTNDQVSKRLLDLVQDPLKGQPPRPSA